jgi:hypothetical protein
MKKVKLVKETIDKKSGTIPKKVMGNQNVTERTVKKIIYKK